MAREIDEEIKRIIEECYAKAEEILTTHMDKLHTVAAALLEVETLDGEQFEALYTGQHTAESLAENVKARDEAIKRANEEEAAERARLIAEEEAREKELLAKFDQNYMSEPDGNAADADAAETESADEAAAEAKIEETNDEEK